MRCLYEVLGVLPEADDATVRTAYRREALRNHPDKNPGDMAAEERFKEVQNAYEILSDKHERAWYDAHRDSILRSGERHQAGAGADLRTERPDDWIDVFAYHTSACYSGFSDGARGFYTVYSNLFERLAKQEESASEQRTTSRNGASATWLPLFGRSDASWEDVSAFYATWGSFATSRDFAWADVYNPASAPNRRVRRAMEQENEKSRRAARREYNEGVRGLVEFLRKRDKRVAAHQVEVAKARQEREEAEKARRETQRIERLERARAFKAAEWAQDSAPSTEASDSEDFAIEEQLVWYCPVCDKHFKSEASMANHERSKKHKELIELLRLQMEEEESALADGQENHLEEQIANGASDGNAEPDGANSSAQEACSSAKTSSSSASSSHDSSEDEGDNESAQQQKRRLDHSVVEREGQEEEEEEGDLEDEDAMLARLMQYQAVVGNQSDSAEAVESSSHSEDSEAGVEVEGGIKVHVESEDEDDNVWDRTEQRRRTQTAKGRRSRPTRAAKAAKVEDGADDGRQMKGRRSQTQGAERQAPMVNNGGGSPLTCGICNAVFKSRNQLFKHIKSTGHAQLKER